MNNRVKDCCVREGTSVLETMRTITNAAVGIALVVDDRARFIGVLTDGDIRRALLNGATLDWEQTLMQQGFKFLNPHEKTSCGCGHSFTV